MTASTKIGAIQRKWSWISRKFAIENEAGPRGHA